jgi:hypothetical protein
MFQDTSVEMGQVFLVLTQILREGFTEFGKSMHGYLTNEAIHMRQSRTSSPCNSRDPITYEHLQINCIRGEGAGYAAELFRLLLMEKCALMIGESLHKKTSI